MQDTVIGVFRSWPAAEEAVRRLEAAGFPADRVSLLAVDPDEPRPAPEEDESSSEEGAIMGAAAGGALGAAGGYALGLASLAIPGIGPVLAAGPLFAALAGLAAGAGAGGLLGSLIGAGVPHAHATVYEEALHRGDVVVSVTEPGRAAEARRILVEAGAVETHEAGHRHLHGPAEPVAYVTAGTMPAAPESVPPAAALDAVEAGETVDPASGALPETRLDEEVLPAASTIAPERPNVR